jgi:hypothetical protein
MRNLDSYSGGKFGEKAKGECQDFGEGNLVQDNQIGSSSKTTEKISTPRKDEDVCYKEGETEKSKTDDNDENLDFDASDDDLLSSQEYDVLIKEMGMDIVRAQEGPMEIKEDLITNETIQAWKNNKDKGKAIDQNEGTRKSTRLEVAEAVKIANKAINREAKDACPNKGMDTNPFTILNFDDKILLGIACMLKVNLGATEEEINSSFVHIKDMEKIEPIWFLLVRIRISLSLLEEDRCFMKLFLNL